MDDLKFELTEDEKAAGLTIAQARKRRDDYADAEGIVITEPTEPGERIVGIATGEKYKP